MCLVSVSLCVHTLPEPPLQHRNLHNQDFASLNLFQPSSITHLQAGCPRYVLLRLGWTSSLDIHVLNIIHTAGTVTVNVTTVTCVVVGMRGCGDLEDQDAGVASRPQNPDTEMSTILLSRR